MRLKPQRMLKRGFVVGLLLMSFLGMMLSSFQGTVDDTEHVKTVDVQVTARSVSQQPADHTLERFHDTVDKNDLLQAPTFPMTEAFVPDVNSTVTLFPSYYHVGLVIRYVGGTDPFIQDVIQFPRQFSVLSIKESKTDLDIDHELVARDNRTDLIMTFNRSLLPSEIVYVGISGIVPKQRQVGPSNTTAWWKFRNDIAFQQVVIRIFPDITYFNASITPDKIAVDSEGFLTLTWSLSLLRGFKVTISTYNTPRSLNELLFVPKTISTILTDYQQQVAVNVTNMGLDGALITLTTPSWLETSRDTLFLPALSEATLSFSLSKETSQDTLSGTIIVATNRSNEAMTVDILVTIKISNGNANLALIALSAALLLFFFLATSLTVLVIKYLPSDHVIKQQLTALKARIATSTRTSNNDLMANETAVSLQQSDHEAFQEQFERFLSTLPDGEQEVLKYVLKHPGCTQQDVADAVGVSKSTVSRVTKRLQARQLLVVEKNGMSHSLRVNKQRFPMKAPEL